MLANRQPGPAAALARAVGVVSVLGAGTTALYCWRLAQLRPLGGNHPALWPLVVLGCWGASTQRVPIRDRKVSFSMSLTGVPLLVALPFLSPASALVAVCCGLGLAQLQRRKGLLKVVVTCLACSAAMSAGILAYDHYLGRSSPESGRGLLVAVAALTVVTLVDDLLLVGAVALLTARWRPLPLRSTLAHDGAGLVACALGGTAAIALMRAGTWAVALFALAVAAGDVSWQRAARAAQRHAALERLYKFTESLALAEGGERELVVAVLEGARSFLSASRAALVVALEAPLDELTLRCSLSGEGPVSFEEAVPRGDLAHLVASRGPLVVARGSSDEEKLAAAHDGFREAVVAPLKPGDPKTGYLLVADREFSHEGFGLGDLKLLEALAANTAAALRKGDLIDKLRNEATVREYEAHHDGLTGLPNRALFATHLKKALDRLDEPWRVALVLVALDGFKQVNETLGHQGGDAVLSEVARRLGLMADLTTFVARVGGDEFALLAEDAGSQEDCLARAGAALASITSPMLVEGLELIVRASIGVATTTTSVLSPAALWRQAETAMFKAKARGGGVWAFGPADERSRLRRLTMAGELRKAVDAGELELHYQLVVDVESRAARGCEALSRWSHEQFGDVPPEQFIVVAERAGLIDPLTWWAMEKSLAQLRAWQAIAPGLSMSVNLSALSLLRRGVAARVADALERHCLAPGALKLELTETSMMAELGRKALAELRELGVALSIDDFGTGYSSLSRLRRLPFDEVKIDRSFVSQMCRVSDDEAVVRSVIELARGLDKVATAEGVEDLATLERLGELGCHRAQGFFLARPMPAAGCEKLLKDVPPGLMVGAGPASS